jgi:1-deoxy-D-xylulose-5-phosphate synthase
LHALEIGKAEILQDRGDVAIIGYGHIVSAVLQAAKKLEEQGIHCTIINARWAKPLDEELYCVLASEKKCIVTVEDAALMGGFGSAVTELFVERKLLPVRMLRIGVPDRVIPQGAPNLLYAKFGLDADGIFERIKSFVTEEGIHATKSHRLGSKL